MAKEAYEPYPKRIYLSIRIPSVTGTDAKLTLINFMFIKQRGTFFPLLR
jgi:hypothetical protein